MSDLTTRLRDEADERNDGTPDNFVCLLYDAADALDALEAENKRPRERAEEAELTEHQAIMDGNETLLQLNALEAERDNWRVEVERLSEGLLETFEDEYDTDGIGDMPLEKAVDAAFALCNSLKSRAKQAEAALAQEQARVEQLLHELKHESDQRFEADRAIAAEREAIRDRSCGTCAHVLVRPGHGDFGDWLRCGCEFAPSYLADVTYTECCRSWSRKRKGEDA